ncbi:MAG: zinc protease [Rhodospirillales bacterium RIFCSPLOWO2_12_FULL_58_28]|nr:MAG: zinc protease [Rhodospirillales bacterium RIFCSPLOWO2_02_FULL_58_16]OHC78722.1 MAG: zinc protease [Rhodospirillales bacterium RIFCSPLOWO2_12_FULL_58_28]
MKFVKVFRWLAGLALLLPASPTNAGVFNPETFPLANGMKVVVVSNHRAPIVTHMVWYKVGAADEPPGKSGIAHLLEHLMFKGTEKMASGEFSKILARNGGQENAFTSHDFTAYYQNIAADRLKMVMELEADRMTNLVITQKQVETERLVILEERRMRTDNDPAGALGEHINAALYLNHPYRRPIIGWEREISVLALDDVRSFYKKWYAPNNATLVIAGDITAKQLRPLAEETYGKIPAVDEAVRIHPQEPPHKAARRVTVKDGRVRQPAWSRSFLAPGYVAGETVHAYALDVLSEILGGGATTRLYKTLVVNEKLAVSAGASYSPNSLGPTDFTFHASPQPGVAMDKLEAAMESKIAELLAGGVTEAEMKQAKVRMQADAVFARDSLSTGAQALGSALSAGQTIEDIETWPERIEAVTVEQINAAARAVLVEENSVTALLLPEGVKP